MPESPFVVVGGGLAGAKAVESLRGGGYDGPLVLLAGEAHAPYERPGLSKGYLQGSQERAKLDALAAGWYAEHDVDLRTGARVTALDPAARTVTTADGEPLAFARLLLATGASPKVPSLPGADGARYLRTVEDSDGLRAAFGDGVRLVVVGAGWIGLEVAAAARAAGCEVTVVEPQPTPLHAVLGPEVGAVFADVHAAHGVRLRTGTGVAAVEPGAVVTSAGDRVEADLVVVGVGAAPEVGLARDAGLAVDNGVLVDELLTTSHPDVFAAGDVANAQHPGLGRRIRVEHWANALNQGKAAGLSMLGKGEPYDRVPYFYTDQFSLGMEYSGYVEPGGYERVVHRGDPAGGEFVTFWLGEGDRVLAGMNVNVWDVTDPIQAMVRAGWRGRGVDVDRLTDPDVPLADVVPAG